MNEPSSSELPKASPLTYRKAGLNDVLAVSQLVRELYSKTCGIYGIPFDYESTVITVDTVVRTGICLIGPTSCAGAIRVPFPYNYRHVGACVLFWYFRKKREIGILEALFKECKQAGVSHVICNSHYPHNTIGRFYRKCGLKPVETQYTGELNKID